jgi:hypothetical protein
MSFQITGLDAAPFRRFYGLSDDELQSLGVKRLIADTSPGFPDRVELRDVEQGEALLLLNYLHQPADTPSCAIQQPTITTPITKQSLLSAAAATCGATIPALPMYWPDPTGTGGDRRAPSVNMSDTISSGYLGRPSRRRPRSILELRDFFFCLAAKTDRAAERRVPTSTLMRGGALPNGVAMSQFSGDYCWPEPSGGRCRTQASDYSSPASRASSGPIATHCAVR